MRFKNIYSGLFVERIRNNEFQGLFAINLQQNLMACICAIHLYMYKTVLQCLTFLIENII